MADTNNIGLDNSAFSGRLRSSAFARDVDEATDIKFDRRVEAEPEHFAGPVDLPTVIKSDRRVAPLEQLKPMAPPQKPIVVEKLEPPLPVYATPKQQTSDTEVEDLFAEQPQQQTEIPIQLIAPEPYVAPAISKQQKSNVITRESVARPIRSSNKKKKNWRPMQMTMMLVAFAIFGVGIGVSLNTIKTNNETQAQLAALAKAASQKQKVEVPAVLGATTTPAQPTKNYVPAADQPKAMRAYRTGVSGMIEPVPMSSANILGGPTDIRNVGWYMSSGKPGDPASVMVMNGYVGTAKHPGAFARINKIFVNDLIQVTTGDDKTVTYKVVQVSNFDPSSPNVAGMLTPAKQGVPTLDLVTVGSTANGNDNVAGTIVFAVQQS